MYITILELQIIELSYMKRGITRYNQIKPINRKKVLTVYWQVLALLTIWEHGTRGTASTSDYQITVRIHRRIDCAL